MSHHIQRVEMRNFAWPSGSHEDEESRVKSTSKLSLEDIGVIFGDHKSAFLLKVGLARRYKELGLANLLILQKEIRDIESKLAYLNELLEVATEKSKERSIEERKETRREVSEDIWEKNQNKVVEVVEIVTERIVEEVLNRVPKEAPSEVPNKAQNDSPKGVLQRVLKEVSEGVQVRRPEEELNAVRMKLSVIARREAKELMQMLRRYSMRHLSITHNHSHPLICLQIAPY